MAMKKKWILIAALAILCILLIRLAVPGAAHVPQNEENTDEENTGEEYTDKSVPVYRSEPTEDTAEIRFYKEAPNTPYISIRKYFDLMLGGGLEVRDDGDGKYTLTNAAGAQAQVDTEMGTVSMRDLPAFENYFDEAKKGEASSFKDSAAPYLRLREVVYEGEPAPVTFDLGKLGISIYGDGSDVWFPVSILSTWLSDIAQNRVVTNGEALYICREKTPYEMDNTCFDTAYYDSILSGEERAEDLTEYSYGELGFLFQYIYGYPGRTELDQEILRGKGFDEALAAYGAKGQKLREELSSRDFREFWFGMYELSEGPMEDGHNSTVLSIGVVDAENLEKYRAFREYTWSKFEGYAPSEFMKTINAYNAGIYGVRPEKLTEEKYYKSPDTAVIQLTHFFVDEEGWNDYYRNGGELPDDTMGTAAKGLRRAMEDGEIKNIVFDLSTNPGGYSDSVMGVLSLMTGRDYLCGYNELSKQPFRVYFDVDRNLDGKIDEKDADVSYDFNYAVLTSGASFSCGNLFPFLVKEDGGMVIGERSGGGSCSVQIAVLSEGFEVSLSGYKFKLTDRSGTDLENGVTPDILLPVETKKESNPITGEVLETLDCSAFGDLDGICTAVSEWFQDNK